MKIFRVLALGFLLSSQAAQANQFTCLVEEPGGGQHEVTVEAVTMGEAYCTTKLNGKTCHPQQHQSDGYGSAKCHPGCRPPSVGEMAQPRPATTAAATEDRAKEGRDNVQRPERLAQSGPCADSAKACLAACGQAKTPNAVFAQMSCKQQCEVTRATCGLRAAEEIRLSR